VIVHYSHYFLFEMMKVDALLEWFDEFCSHNDGLRRVVANELIKNITFTTTATSQQQPTTESQTSQLSTTSTATTTMTMLECFMRSYNSLRPDSKLKMQAFFFQLMRDMFFKKIFAIHFTNLYKDLAKYYTRGIIE
jgi:capsule polysaccharide export protein KpsE/RkpR